MSQLIRTHVHFLVVSELRPLLSILGVRLDVDGHQPSKVSVVLALFRFRFRK